MDMTKQDIIDRLLKIDADMALLDNTDDSYICVIVGGSALVVLDKIYRSTHDIDSIQASDELKPLLEAYNINMNVRAYYTNFSDSYRDRLIPIDIPTKKILFYTLSLEDLVVSKLCAMREKDQEDIENDRVYSALDWDVLDRLVEDVCYGMLKDSDAERLRATYQQYKETFQCEH